MAARMNIPLPGGERATRVSERGEGGRKRHLGVLAGNHPLPPASRAPPSPLRGEGKRALALLFLSLLAAAPIPASQLVLTRHDADIDFEWSATPFAATQPKLLAALRGDAARRLAQARREAAADRNGRGAYPDYHKHYLSEDWSRAAETPQLLVLSAKFDSYSGGAHGMNGFDVAVWDKAAQARIAPTALFADWPRAKALLTKPFCDALTEERARRRSEPATLEEFNDCPALDRQTIIPSGGVDGRIVSLAVRIAPYEAGPYAEGSYELFVDLPAPVIALVKPAYRTAFGYRAN